MEGTLLQTLTLTLGVSHTNVCCRLALGGQNMDFTIPLIAIVQLRQVILFKQDTTKGWTPNVMAGHETLFFSFRFPS